MVDTRVTMLAWSCMALTVLLFGAQADGPPTPPAEATADQWIAPLSDDMDSALGEDWVEERMGDWVVWPSDEEVKARGPLRDRRAEYRAEQTVGTVTFRFGLDAVSPDEARADAADWVRRILRPELVPDDLDDRFILLQEQDPSRSSVRCRFETDAAAIQVTQLRWALCVVIRAGPALSESLAPEAYCAATFRAVFTEGDKMAKMRGRVISGLPYPTWQCLDPGFTAWSGRFVWYTDDRAVAVYARRLDTGTEHPQAGDPWF